ncbi:MAG: branched-chain amino acid ABC transporter permease [Betaproteobacteria bacterium]|nr:branched-chain amino acid ABC transporter permease [Betaproteobacteria bacterium]
MLLILEQTLNGLQLGVLLFLMAAGLTLVFGVMQMINLAHGSMFMIGAYVCAAVFAASGSYVTALLAALVVALTVGIGIEVLIFRSLYQRDHLDQVLATFGLILVFNELMRVIWGPSALHAGTPPFLGGHIEIIPGIPYPVYRLAILGVGLVLAILLYLLVAHTKLGMLIRAGASNRIMVQALGANIGLIYTLVFGLGAVLAAFAGVMAAPLLIVEPGMGEGPLILAFVVIVIGGIGSVKGALVGAIFVGWFDTMGRAFLKPILGLLMSPAASQAAAPAIASMLIYILMAVVLLFRPRGLFPPRTR